MKQEYEMHSSEHIRNLGNGKKPQKKIVGLRLTVLCLALTFAGYLFIVSSSPEKVSEIKVTVTAMSLNSILMIGIGAVLLLCVLVVVLIRTIKNKKE